MIETKFDSPSEAIFIARFAKDDKPLFESQLELANKIINHPGSEFKDKNIITVRSTLSQIFTGERNLSKNLRNILFQVIEKRFDKKKFNFDQFEKLLIEEFRIGYEERLEIKRNGIGDIDYKSLIERTKSATDFLITTLEPAELHKSELADRLKNELLEKTGIVPPSSDKVISAKYKFYLPNKQLGRVARQFWEELRKHAIKEYEMQPGEVDEKLKIANQKEIIQTFLVPVNIAMHPYVFIDFYPDKRKVRGFCVSYKNQIPSVAELSLEVVYTWFEEYENELKEMEKQTDVPFYYESE
jgi:hypothetical protein